MKIDQSRSGTIGPALVKKAKASSSAATKRIKFIENSNCGGKVDSEKKRLKIESLKRKAEAAAMTVIDIFDRLIIFLQHRLLKQPIEQHLNLSRGNHHRFNFPSLIWPPVFILTRNKQTLI